MPKAHTTWTVLEHGEIEQLADNLWRVEAALPGIPVRRTMTVARMRDGRLVVHSPISLDDARMSELEGLGEIAWVIVPNGWHRLDARVWRDRYPKARFACPEGARRKVEQVVRVDATFDEAIGDEAVRVEHIDGMKKGEGVMIVRSGDSATLVFTDLVTNMQHFPGAFGFVYRLVGGTGGPRIHGVIRRMLVKDCAATRAHLDRLAGGDVRRIVVAHGAVINRDAGATLRRVAGML